MPHNIEIFSDIICSIGIVFIFITMVTILSYEINTEVNSPHNVNKKIIENRVVGIVGGLLLVLCSFLSIDGIIPYYIGITIFIGLVAYLSGKTLSANIALFINLIFSCILLKWNNDLGMFHIMNTIFQLLVLNIIKITKIRLSYKRNLIVILLALGHAFFVLQTNKDVNMFFSVVTMNLICGYIIALVTVNANRLVKMYNAYRKQALTDALTGIANVRAYNTIISHLGKNKDRQWSIIYIDIDNFKRINQEYGHSTGDIIIRGVGRVIRNMVPYDDYCFRVGGDEFLILHNQCNVVSAKELAQKIKDSVGIKEFMSTSKEEVVNITLSIGINSEQTRHCDICELVDKADKAMFEAKRQGKDTISIAGSKPS